MKRKLKLIGILLFFLIAVSTVVFFQPIAVARSEGGAQKKEAPSFSVETLENSTVSLDNYRGKVLLLEFFASWCHVCKNATPELKQVRKKFSSENLAILSIESSPSVSIEDVENFKSEYGGDWPFAKAPEVADKYGVEGYPTTFIVDRDGYIADKLLGSVGSEVISQKVNSVLEGAKPPENQPETANMIVDVSVKPENAGGIVATSLKTKKNGVLLFTCEVKANSGYKFEGWIGKEIPKDQENSPTLKITPSLGTEVTAKFAPSKNASSGAGNGATGPLTPVSLALGAVIAGSLGVLGGYLVWGRGVWNQRRFDKSCLKKTRDFLV